MPVALPGPADRVVLGGHNACALIGGHYWCWGLNMEGELGLGTTSNFLSPQQRCP